MKNRLLFAIVFAFSASLCQAQSGVLSTLGADLTAVQVIQLTDTTYQVNGNYNDPMQITDGTDLQAGDVLWSPALNPGDTCRRYVIDNIIIGLLGYVQFQVTDSGQGVPSTQISKLLRETPNLGLVYVTTGTASDALVECISRHYSMQLDDIQLGGDPSEVTDLGNSVYMHVNGANDTTYIDTREGVSSDADNLLQLGTDSKPFIDEVPANKVVTTTELGGFPSGTGLQTILFDLFGNVVDSLEISQPDDSTYVFTIFNGVGETLARDTAIITPELAFDSDRPILNVPEAGDTIGGTTFSQWLEYWYLAPQTPPQITLDQQPTFQFLEVGDSVQFVFTGTVSNPGGATLSNGEFAKTYPVTEVLKTFGSGTSVVDTVIHTPKQAGLGNFNLLSYSFEVNQDWEYAGGPSGNAISATRTIKGVYPIFHGMSFTDYSDTGTYPGLALGTAPYTALTKLIDGEGDQTIIYNGTGYIYYFIPKNWNDFDLSLILDHNDLDVTASFDAFDVTISSTGRVNDWVNVQYKMYKLRTATATNNFDYEFIR